MAVHGGADVASVESVVEDIRDVLPPGCVLVTKSTVPVGTAARVHALLGRDDVRVASNPEFLRESNALHDFLEPQRIVIGSDDEDAIDVVAKLYDGLSVPVVRTDVASAELAKYASNGFLAMKLSYVNMLAELCEKLGADIDDVTRSMGYDDRIGPSYLSPGPGWGGSCLPKDTQALLSLAAQLHVDFAMLRNAVEVNTRQVRRTVAKVRHAVTGSSTGSLQGIRLALLGLTFKAGTDDLRASPALAVANLLADEGAKLYGYDPCVPAGAEVGPVELVADPYQAANDAAAVVLLTEWPQFRTLDWTRLAAGMANRVLVDTRNHVRDMLTGTDLAWRGVGRNGRPSCG
jgi:UDPglucose 6-dehydrogenase